MLIVKNISKNYSENEIFKNLSFQLEKGQCLGIVGKNGAGKTTLLNCLLDPKIISAGTIENKFQTIGVQFQDAKFDVNLRVKEIIDIYMVINDGNNENLKKYSQLLDLKIDNTKFDNLSGGQKQKLSILCAILHNPDLLIFDEITTGLDYLTRIEIYKIIKDLKAEGKTIILVTHYFEELNNLADNVLVLTKNRHKIIPNSQNYEKVLLEEIL